MRKLLALGAALLLVLSLAAPTLATDFSQGGAANAAANWKVYNYNLSNQAYASRLATTFNTGIGFDFLSKPDTALFVTKQDKSLLGDLTLKTITATFTINGAAGAAFTYYGAFSGGTPASVRLFFEGNTNGPFTYDTVGFSKYWWSNPDSATLASVVGNTVTLTVPVDTAHWSNWGGQLASDVPTYFAAAVSDVSMIGLSFGGGYFFANGVGMSAGSASFVLSGYTVNP